jgi:flavin-dependent dehydrogenase
MDSTLPVIIAGMGPGGAAAAMQLHAAGRPVIALDRGDEKSTLARNIFLRPQAREELQKLTGITYGRDATIMELVNTLRETAKQQQVDARYHQKITNVVREGDHVNVTVQPVAADGSLGAEQTIAGSAFIDGSGGHIDALNAGKLDRHNVGKSHYYVTAQYSTPVPSAKGFGTYDPKLDRTMFCLPIGDGASGFVAYYDYAPGVTPDAKEAVADYNALADKLGFGTPLTGAQGFNAQEHLSKQAVDGPIIRVGDSAGNADPYVGAGFAAALIDARNAAGYILDGDFSDRRARATSDDILAGHKSLIGMANAIVWGRSKPSLFRHTFHNADFTDPNLTRDAARPSFMLDMLANVLTKQRVHERWHPFSKR